MATSNNNKGSTPEKLIKSKERVRDLAEVYTAEREVCAMLDLVPDFSLTQTFLEPACGNGNFLIEILRRKLQAHPATRPYYERDSEGRLAPFPKTGRAKGPVLWAIQALSTLYGFDICPNNIAETQARLYAYVLYGEDLLLPGFLTGSDPHTRTYLEAVTLGNGLPLAADYEGSLFRLADQRAQQHPAYERAVSVSSLLRAVLKLVLVKNFQQGDFLARQGADGQPLTVCKWTFRDRKVCRDDFLLADVGTNNPQPVNVVPPRSLTEFLKGAGYA